MPENQLRRHKRYARLLRRIKQLDHFSADTAVHGGGWLLSFILLALLSDADLYAVVILLFIHFYFLKVVLRGINDALAPPVELLLLLLWLVLGLDIGFSSLTTQAGSGPPGWLLPLHLLLLASITLLFALVLVINNKGKLGVVVSYFFLGVVTGALMNDGRELLLLIFQLILFLLLLRRTSWLEELTRAECLLYFALFFILFLLIQSGNPYLALPRGAGNLMLWTFAPAYLFMLFKLYILAVLVKIPVVLVYNHARLARKLYISGLFQSTFPQIIQFVMLLLIFHFFIAGWQAENVRQAVISQIDEMRSPGGLEALDYLRVYRTAIGEELEIRGFAPIRVRRILPDQGIVAIPRSRKARFADESPAAYFLFFRPEDAALDSVYFVELERELLQLISRNTHVLAGSALLGYPYTPNAWESFFYTPTFLSEDRDIRLFPYAIAPQTSGEALTAPIENRYVVNSIQGDLDVLLFSRRLLTLGRILMPMYDGSWREKGYYVFDVLLEPDLSFLLSPIVRNIVSLFALYLLINILLIRRVIKFGSEINRMIVQKFNQLKKGIVQISSGNLDYKVQLEGQDEFVELGERFNQMGDKLKQTIAEAREKDRLEHELRIARRVQHSLIPPSLPEVRGYSVAATFQTATEVGGDFYDLTPLGDNKFLFTIGDVSGKSTSAAFYMAQCISLIRFSPQFTTDPREIALRLNRYFCDPLIDRQMFVTAIVGLLNANNDMVTYVRAGHTPPIFLPGDTRQPLRELKIPGLGIGLSRQSGMLEKTLQIDRLKMAAGDTLVFYTDGVIEATRSMEDGPKAAGSAEFFGEERLWEILEQNRGTSALELQTVILTALESIYQGKPPVDDYTLLIIQKQRS